MKLFVTVGTTAFDELIQQVDQQLVEGYQVTCQIADGRYLPVNHSYFNFSHEINRYYSSADLVITHGGAGSIFKLLEQRKKLLIVPNLQRVDSHQRDICHFMENNQFAMACHDLNHLKRDVEQAIQTNFVEYNKTDFIGADEIRKEFGLIDHINH